MLTPGEMGLPRDARLVQLLDDDDQEASLNQRRQERPFLGPSFADSSPVFWGQFASSLVKAGFSGGDNVDSRIETKGGGSHRWLTPQRGSENYVAIVPINGSKLERHQC